MADPRDEFIDSLAEQLGLEPLGETEIESVLALAATAAHGTGDRTSAPLAAFLAGSAAAGAAAAGTAASESREDVLDRVRKLAGTITGPQGE